MGFCVINKKWGARPLPPRIYAAPEDLAKAMFTLPSDHECQRQKKDARACETDTSPEGIGLRRT